MERFSILTILTITVCTLNAQTISYEAAKSYADRGDYMEAIHIMKQLSVQEYGTEYYIDDIAMVARYYSQTSYVDSIIKYNTYLQQLAKLLINKNDSIAEEYIQSTAWNYYGCGLYEYGLDAAQKVLELRSKISGQISEKTLEWIGVMAFQSFKAKDISSMVSLCEKNCNIAIKLGGYQSSYYKDAISSVRAYAHKLSDSIPGFTTKWIEPYYMALKHENILPKYQYEFAILQLDGFLSLGNLKSADQYALEAEQWTFVKDTTLLTLDDKIRLFLKLGLYSVRKGDHIQGRVHVIKAWDILKEINKEPSLEQLIDRHIIERELRMDSDENSKIKAQWLIETSTEIIDKGEEASDILAFFYESRAWAYDAIGKYDLAINDIISSISLHPLNSRKKKLAQIYLANGDYQKAESQYLALYSDSTLSEVLRKSIISDLTALYWIWEKKEKLTPFLIQDFYYSKVDIKRAFAFLNENERETFFENSQIGSTISFDIYTFFSRNGKQWDDGNELAYNLALTQKGMLLSTKKI